MKNFQKLLFVAFIITNALRTALNCFALNQLIKILGPDKLGLYYGYSFLISIVAIILLTFLSRKVPSSYRFLGLHALFTFIAACCLFLPNEILQTKLIFLSLMGLDIILYFNNWSLAATFISPFESKRLFPLLGTATQIGIFAGALMAMASHFALSSKTYLMIWLIGEGVVVVMAIPMFIFAKSATRQQQTIVEKEHPPTLLQLIRHDQLVPRLTFWVFLWGLLFYSISSLTGATFDKTGINLTLFYGILTLSGAILSILTSLFLYPKIVRWLGLGAILLGSSIFIFITGGIYLAFDHFAIAIAAFMVFKLIDDSFVIPALSVGFGLYPSTHRDRLRLLAEILAMTAGGACVGILFSSPSSALRWVLALLFLIFVIVGFFCRGTFMSEVLKFLKSEDPEELNNAIAIFDTPEIKENYNKVLDRLLNSEHLSARVNILNTFANLETIKPAVSILQLFKNTNIEPLRIAILRYMEHIPFKKLDPFLQYQVFENLKTTCRAKASNILRSLAVKIFIQNGSPDVTVSFIVEALKDKDDRVVANAIEGLNYVEYPGIITLLKPFLKSPIPRVRANCIMTLWKYSEIKNEAVASLDEMLTSENTGEMISGIFAAGEVKDLSRKEYLKEKLTTQKKEILRGTVIALLKLGYEEIYQKAVEIILGDDETQAIYLCYLSLRLEERILNELIIAYICSLGEKQKTLAHQRYSHCGGFCRDQLNLLEGKKLSLPFTHGA